MHRTKMIPINAILKDMYFIMNDVDIKEDAVIEFAIRAMEHLVTYKLYEKAVCMIPVENSKAEYPSGMLGIESVMYSLDCNELESSDLVLTSNTCIEATEEGETINKNVECKITNFRMERFMNRGWDFLSLSNNTYNRSIVCKDSINLFSECNHWFIPDSSSSQFILSFDEGLIAVAYYRYPQDEYGNFLIPDHPLYLEAVESYVLSRIYQRMWHLSKQGAQSKYQHYLQKWQELSAAAKGEFLMLSLPEYINMEKQNRFFKDDDPRRIYTGHGRESIDLGNRNNWRY